MPDVLDTVHLTEQEAKIFKTLLEACRQAGLSTTLRCAGGWVRDKLLGKDSLDIDIALDNLMGRQFADHVNAYLEKQGADTRTVAVILSNPDQSKHLETARMKVHGVWLDLVNLRSETYAEGSRIPTMEFGTPEQDALRRDFTINSLFYNINESVVEDFTGRGRDDLRAGLIRTPLPAEETFSDDPLRVLRAIRFAARFGFELDQELQDAAASQPVREALEQKVSRERVGTEVEGMFAGAAPVEAMATIHTLRLFPAVFGAPRAARDALSIHDAGARCVAVMATAEAALRAWAPQEPFSGEERRLAHLAALLLPLRAASAPLGKGKSQPLSIALIRESLKWKAKDGEQVAALHAAAPNLLRLAQQLQGLPGASKQQAANGAGGSGSAQPYAGTGDEARIALGGALRQLKGLWRVGVLLAPLLQLPEAAPLGVDAPQARDCSTEAVTLPASSRSEAADAQQAAAQRSAAVCRELEAAVAAFGLERCWEWKPLLDGKQVMAALGMTKGGPQLGRACGRVVDWQLAHPQGSAADCQAWLVQAMQDGA